VSDLVSLELVDRNLEVKEETQEYKHHGDALESSLYLDFFLDMYNGKILEARIVLLWLSHGCFPDFKYDSYKSENWYVGRSYQGDDSSQPTLSNPISHS
jgi:hypothetical protein